MGPRSDVNQVLTWTCRFSIKDPDPKITVIVVIKNRARSIVENFLFSFLQQPPVPRIVIVDYGSTEDNVNMLKGVWWNTRAFDLIRVTRGVDPFCKARGLNVGLKTVISPFSLFTDIDVMFGKGVVAEVRRTLDANPPCIATVHTFNMFKGRDYRTGWITDRLYGRYYNQYAVGGCLAAKTDWFMSIHGFDEGFVNWGGEDWDMWQRAGSAGRPQIRLNKRRFRLWHQWHPHLKDLNPVLYKKAWSDGIRRCTNLRKIVVRNLKGWGEL